MYCYSTRNSERAKARNRVGLSNRGRILALGKLDIARANSAPKQGFGFLEGFLNTSRVAVKVIRGEMALR